MDKKNLITITFDSEWIAEKIKAGLRIVRLLEDAVREDNRARVSKSSRACLSIETDPTHRIDLLNRLAKVLTAETGEEAPWAHAKFSGDLAGLDVPREVPLHQAPPPPGANADSPQDPVLESRKTVAEILRHLCEEIPLRLEPELVKYLQEVASVVPRLQMLGAMDHFWQRNLLVSIDDGWGFTAFVNSLCTLYRALEIAPQDGRSECVEITLQRNPGENPESDWENAIKTACSLSASVKKGQTVPLLCLDVSAWQDNLSDPKVKEYLRQINDSASGVVCVFRVTFLEPGVLKRVERDFSDILDICVIAAPPASMDDMVTYVKERLIQSDFVLQDDAKHLVEGWILGEMSDGSFFGYKTLDKIASRVVYNRVLVAPPESPPAELRTLDEATLRTFPGVPSDEDDPETFLSRLIGMDDAKKKLQEIIAQLSAQRELTRKGRRVRSPSIHMAFTGAPGTGKTTMARIVAGLLKKAGLLRKGYLVEVKGRDLCGEYIGATAPKTSSYCRRALGSVLFIDEAYSLYRGKDSSSRGDFGREALDTLVAEMENHREDLCIILAGYPDEMARMLKANAGLNSRIPYRIFFPNYSRSELGDIFFSMLDEGGFARGRGLEKTVRDFFARIPDATMEDSNFGNARLVRNLYERVWGKAANRFDASNNKKLSIRKADFEAAAKEPEFASLFEVSAPRPKIGFVQGDTTCP